MYISVKKISFVTFSKYTIRNDKKAYFLLFVIDLTLFSNYDLNSKMFNTFEAKSDFISITSQFNYKSQQKSNVIYKEFKNRLK